MLWIQTNYKFYYGESDYMKENNHSMTALVSCFIRVYNVKSKRKGTYYDI